MKLLNEKSSLLMIVNALGFKYYLYLPNHAA